MATDPQVVLNLINQEITANGNNEITADILAPVLRAIVQQANALIGDQADFPQSSTTVAEALTKLDEEKPKGLTILSGTADPNIIPPPSFSISDFYQLLDGSNNTIAFYQYNGIGWAKILVENETNQKPIKEINSNYAITANDFTVVYTGSNPMHTIDLPLAFDNPGRLLKVCNLSTENINFTTNYISNDGSTSTLIASETVIQLQSNGIDWIKIN